MSKRCAENWVAYERRIMRAYVHVSKEDNHKETCLFRRDVSKEMSKRYEENWVAYERRIISAYVHASKEDNHKETCVFRRDISKEMWRKLGRVWRMYDEHMCACVKKDNHKEICLLRRDISKEIWRYERRCWRVMKRSISVSTMLKRAHDVKTRMTHVKSRIAHMSLWWRIKKLCFFTKDVSEEMWR